MVQAPLFRKSNPDSHYANAVFKFMKIRPAKNRQNVAFFSADAKCKMPVGESDFSIASVARGEIVIVGSNETFMVGDHDFTELSLIPDAYLLHELLKTDDSEERPKAGEWYTGQVYYGSVGVLQFYFCNFYKIHAFGFSLYNLSLFIIYFLIPLVTHGFISSFFIFLRSVFFSSMFVEISFK